MATITKEIKDQYVIPIALKLGYSPSKGDTMAMYLAAIQSRVDEMIDPLYEQIVLDDPQVKIKLTELEALKTQLTTAAMPAPTIVLTPKPVLL